MSHDRHHIDRIASNLVARHDSIIRVNRNVTQNLPVSYSKPTLHLSKSSQLLEKSHVRMLHKSVSFYHLYLTNYMRNCKYIQLTTVW
jgi:hypothetical protein